MSSTHSAWVGVRLHSRMSISPWWLDRRVLPLVDELRERHGAVMIRLQPGWLHGPHVELTAHRGRRGPLPWRELAAAWDGGPADPRHELSPRAYLDQARALGRSEQVPPPYLPLHEHGTALPLTEAERTAPWPGALAQLREYALGRLLEPVCRTIRSLAEQPAAAPERVAEAFLAVAAAHPYGIGHGCFSFRSHAEAFFNSTGDAGDGAAPAGGPRAAFRRRLDTQGEPLAAAVHRALEGGESADAAAWRGALAYCTGLFESAAVRGEVDGALLDSWSGTGHNGGGEADGRMPSAFHRAVAASGATDGDAAWFTGYRVMINLFYRQLPLLGVSPLQRYYLCYGVAETVDRMLGVTWQERLATAPQDGGPEAQTGAEAA
ncbi:hypothetical protein ACFVY4_24850 [Streptomyces sp. NPDC058299]|uniref:hypothetical protein n=1 Tax=Streptomyces sp. NPDC058299 TaxID=3346435 RepID=UPI0036E5272B